MKMFHAFTRRLMFVLSPIAFLLNPVTELILYGVRIFEKRYRIWESERCNKGLCNYCDYCIFNNECQRFKKGG
jgi:TRAP-type mannitol/chloroaromatic compound transport system permease small subunit